MTADPEPQMEYDDGGLPGPGAPTPISALEVRSPSINPATLFSKRIATGF
jgi:hypothetical protein